ncbi:MAG: shikimate kinase [Phycisphaerales bacterium]|nr:shikimate kinase [Phycisphaerales bacterium]
MSTIAIIGYRGSGKTTISQWIAKHLDMPCIDTDDWVLEHLGVSVQSVWNDEDEARWRMAEAEIVPSLLEEDAVVSIGGASLMPDNVKEALKKVSLVINCVADEETTLARIEKGEDRPMSHAMLHADALQVRSERLAIYDSLATHQLDSNGDLASVIPRIEALLKKSQQSG